MLHAGTNVMHVCARENRLETLLYLHEQHDAPIDIVDLGGRTPLMYAAEEGHLDMCKVRACLLACLLACLFSCLLACIFVSMHGAYGLGRRCWSTIATRRRVIEPGAGPMTWPTLRGGMVWWSCSGHVREKGWARRMMLTLACVQGMAPTMQRLFESSCAVCCVSSVHFDESGLIAISVVVIPSWREQASRPGAACPTGRRLQLPRLPKRRPPRQWSQSRQRSEDLHPSKISNAVQWESRRMLTSANGGSDQAGGGPNTVTDGDRGTCLGD